MEENKYTDLDKLFRERMGDLDPEGYDMPDDGVLEGALLQLDNKPKRRGFWMLFFFGIVFIGLIALVFQNDKELLKGEEVHVVDLKQKQAAKYKPTEPETSKEEELKPFNALAHSDSEEPVEQKFHTEIANAERPVIDLSKEKHETQSNNVVNTLAIKTVETVPVIPEVISVSSIPAIGMNVLEIEQRRRMKGNILPVVEETRNALSVSIFASALYTSFTMSNGNGQLIEELIDYDKYYLGYRGGVALTQQISSEFDLSYQLSYAKINNESAYESDMKYQGSNEYIGSGGELMYSDQLSAQTPIGVLSRNVSFDTENTGLAEDEKMRAKTKTAQSYKLLSFGASLSYNLAKIGPLFIQPSIGLRSSYLMGLDHTTEIEMYHNNQMFFQEEQLGQEKEMVNPLLFSGELGMNLSLKISKQITSSLSVGYEQNFNSLRKTSPLDITKTNYNSFFFGLKSSYTF